MTSSDQKEKDVEKEEDSADPLFGGKVAPYRNQSQTNSRQRFYLIVIVILVILVIPLFGGKVAPYRNQSHTNSRQRFYLIVIVILVILLICAIVSAIVLYQHEPQHTHETSQKHKGVRPIFPSLLTGAVVSDHETCSQIGRNILSQRGSAVDAAIATLICNGVMTPHSIGIGGGCFMIIYDKDARESIFIDGRETGPREMNADEFYEYKQNRIKFNARRIGIPGELLAYKRAHDIYGHLPWKDLFQPTLKLMEKGLVMREATHEALVAMARRLGGAGLSLANYTELCEVFCNNTETGEPLQAGDRYYWPKLMETLANIAEQGPDYLYDGPITSTVVKELQEKGSFISMLDFLMDYDIVTGPALTVDYGNHTLYTIGQATGGPIVAEILNILEGYNFTRESISTIKNKTDTIHKMIEAFKFAYADRQSIEDPDFGKDMQSLIQQLVSKDYAARLRDKITMTAHDDLSYYKTINNPDTPDDMGTSHVSVLSPYGDAVSVTSTINWYFGSLEMSNSTGIIWNNEMDDFSSSKAAVNLYEPGKRPRSSMAPVIVADKTSGQVRLVIGAAGGSRIATAVAQVVAKMLWLEDDLKTVIDQRRFHHGLVNGDGELDKLELEKDFKELNECVVQELVEDRNHTIKDQQFPRMSVIESIFVHDNNTVEAVPDERKLHRARS